MAQSSFFTGRNEVVAKVMFLQVSVIHSVHRGGLPQCMLGYHSPPDQAETPPGPGTPAPQTWHTTPRPGTPPDLAHPPDLTPPQDLTPPRPDTPLDLTPPGPGTPPPGSRLRCNMLQQPPIKSWHRSIFTGINLPSGTISTIFLMKNRPYPCCVRHALLSALPLTLERQGFSSTCVLLYNHHCNQCKLLSRSPHHISGQAYCTAQLPPKNPYPPISKYNLEFSANKSYLLKLFSKIR